MAIGDEGVVGMENYKNRGEARWGEGNTVPNSGK